VLEEAAMPHSALGDFVADLLGGKKIDPRRAGAAVGEVFEAVFSAAAAGNRARARGANGFSPFAPFAPFAPFFPHGGNPPRSAQRPPPPQIDEDAVKRLRARKLVGFTAQEVLTVEIVRRRQRELGKRFHPDLYPPEKRKVAGEKMAAITGACALLMEDLR
jgi:hypothetical protein